MDRLAQEKKEEGGRMDDDDDDHSGGLRHHDKRRRLDDEWPELEPRSYDAQRVLGRGSFGVVYQALVQETGEIVALKTMKPTHENLREVAILKELRDHPNIVSLRGAFISGRGTPEERLVLVLEFLSDTLHRIIKHYKLVLRASMPTYLLTLYTYQLLRGLAFMHGRGLAHCDIKPQNLLVDGKRHALKICDFGTSRRLFFGEDVFPYICSRYYRAPELILGCSKPTPAIDIWSAGCVFAEMRLGQPLFAGGDNAFDQLAEIFKVMGTPSPQDLRAMNPQYPPCRFSVDSAPLAWAKVFRSQGGGGDGASDDLAGLLLRYDPNQRTPALGALLHRFFDRLRQRPSRLLFDFRADELLWCTAEDRRRLLSPLHGLLPEAACA
jgi:serine/threonine protein kinase